MTGAMIAFYICATVIGVAIIVSRTIENIRTHDSYWKIMYELEKSAKHSFRDPNEDIIRNTKDEELTEMLKAYYEEKEEPTNEAAE